MRDDIPVLPVSEPWSFFGESFVTFFIVVGLGVAAILYLSLRESKALSKMATAGLLGCSGVALEVLAPRGMVNVRGELWKAVSVDGLIEKDAEIEVVNLREGLVVEVSKKR